jgi:hypothetical protein
MAVSPEMITKVRIEIQDTATGLYILDDSTITYFLEKNNESIQRASLDAARAVLMQLSIRANDSTVDIFSIKGSKAAQAYKEALQLYLKDSTLNPVLNNCQGYFGNVSIADMQSNDSTVDNNIVQSPSTTTTYTDTSNYFGV